jgi:hypothetical protein
MKITLYPGLGLIVIQMTNIYSTRLLKENQMSFQSFSVICISGRYSMFRDVMFFIFVDITCLVGVL